MGGLRQRTISGIKWQIGVSLFQKAVTFATTIVLARRLGPSVYGLFAFSLVIVSSFELFKSMGIDAALVRRKDDFAAAANTAFLIIPVLGITLYLLLHLSAPLIGKLLNNAEVVPIVKILGLIFVFGCFSKVPNISLERDMQFKKLSVAEVICTFAFSLCALVLVMLGFGIWTLVFAYLARTVVNMVLVWIFSGWRPAFTFDRKLALEMFHFGKFIFLTSAIWFLKSNLDNLLVGRLLGTTMLGLYAVAMSLANFASDYFGGRIYRVMYPAYSKLQGDTVQLKRAFLNVLRYISLLAFPMALGVFFLGGDFIRLTYADKWLGAIPVLRVLAWVGISNLMLLATDSVFMAMGKPNLSFWSILVQVGFFFLFVTPAARLFGLMGVGMVVTAASVTAMLLQFAWLMRHLSLSFKEIFSSVYTPLTATLIMVAAILAFKIGLPHVVAARYAFIEEFLVASVIYVLALFVMNRLILKEMREMVFS